MFNKEGIPFFTIIIPFLSVLLISFLSISFYMKISAENLNSDITEFKEFYYENKKDITLEEYLSQKELEYKLRDEKFLNFIYVVTFVVISFMAFFSYVMILIVRDVVKKYKIEVQNRESELKSLNENLAMKVEIGIEEGKQKDKKILEQGKVARLGSMISMIAHQWRQPLTQLSAILMELETATRFKKVDDNYILE